MSQLPRWYVLECGWVDVIGYLQGMQGRDVFHIDWSYFYECLSELRNWFLFGINGGHWLRQV